MPVRMDASEGYRPLAAMVKARRPVPATVLPSAAATRPGWRSRCLPGAATAHLPPRRTAGRKPVTSLTSGRRPDTLERMRNPADDGTDQRASRRRHRAAVASGTGASGARRLRRTGASGTGASGTGASGDSGRHRSPGGSARSGATQAGPATGAGPDGAAGSTRAAGAGPAGGPGSGSSVFAPGYDASRPGSGPARGGGESGRSSWYGSAADGAAGKGPVRGYPPAPGQPSPMYPPGQFAAWNRGRDGRARTAPGPDGRTAGDSGRPRADRPQPGPPGADQGGRGPQQSSWQSARPAARRGRGTTAATTVTAATRTATPSPATQCWRSAIRPRT